MTLTYVQTNPFPQLNSSFPVLFSKTSPSLEPLGEPDRRTKIPLLGIMIITTHARGFFQGANRLDVMRIRTVVGRQGGGVGPGPISTLDVVAGDVFVVHGGAELADVGGECEEKPLS